MPAWESYWDWNLCLWIAEASLWVTTCLVVLFDIDFMESFGGRELVDLTAVILLWGYYWWPRFSRLCLELVFFCLPLTLVRFECLGWICLVVYEVLGFGSLLFWILTLILLAFALLFFSLSGTLWRFAWKKDDSRLDSATVGISVRIILVFEGYFILDWLLFVKPYPLYT